MLSRIHLAFAAGRARYLAANIAVTLTLAMLFVIGFPTPAFAADDPNLIELVLGGGALSLVDILQLGVIPLLPALVGYVNRAVSIPAFWKRAILALLSIVAQMLPDFIQSLNAAIPYNWLMALFAGIVAYALAEATFQGFYKMPLHRAEPADEAISTTVGPDVVTVSVAPAPVTIASKIAGQ